MHELRTALRNGSKPSVMVIARKEKCRRADRESSLTSLPIPREERRATNQRREDRFRGVVERATISFRRKKSLVKVVNLSGGGVLIESSILPSIGEKIGVEFQGFDRLDGTVRWVKDGRVGIDVGEQRIDIG